MDPQPLHVTSDGQNIVTFDLIDDDGYFVACGAIGRNATNNCLVSGTHVILYHCLARGGQQGRASIMMLQNDALMVPLNRRRALATPRERISFS